MKRPATVMAAARSLCWGMALTAGAVTQTTAAGAVAQANAATPVERGRYLAAIAGCAGCHTPWGEHGLDESKLYGGSPPRPSRPRTIGG